ncbi:MAG: 2-amino-4-hydroxy-6-hydroxymethyldihydropteridine diphosphokinase [Gemmatimonadota bacterium]
MTEQRGSARAGEPVAVGLGSNLGDRLAHLRFGLARVGAFLQDLTVSAVYETDPIGYLAQPRFLNACCVGRTGLSARQLLSELQDAERAAGRRPSGPRYGPRALDLDLLLLGAEAFESPTLTVPHPRMSERAFVLVPLAEIAADWPVPGTQGREASTVSRLAEAVSRKGITRTELTL